MTTESTADEHRITTGEVVAACTKDGVEISARQLRRWAAAGLLKRSKGRGRGLGQGRGTVQTWEQDTVPRAVLIARTLETGDPTYKRAARTLAESGYPPSADWLRALLLDEVDKIALATEKRRPFMRQELGRRDKSQRLRESVHNRNKIMPRWEREALADFVEAVTGLDIELNQSPVTRLGRFLQPPHLRQAINDISDSDLAEIFQVVKPASTRTQSWLPIELVFLALIFVVFLAFRQPDRPIPLVSQQDRRNIPPSHDSPTLYWDPDAFVALRLLGVAQTVFGDPFLSAYQEAIEFVFVPHSPRSRDGMKGDTTP